MSGQLCNATTHHQMGEVTCSLARGHAGNHWSAGTQVQWPNVRPLDQKSREAEWERRFQAAGRNRDEMILQLFDALAEVERRLTDLGSRLNNASLNHDVRTDQNRITGLGRQISSLAEVLPFLLDGLGQRIEDSLKFQLESGREVDRGFLAQQTDHVIRSLSRETGQRAAVRCATKFREGPCLGYAGHDGDCSAVPDSGNPQMEDPSEFAESTYDRTSDGTPMKGPSEFEQGSPTGPF